jgi:beta-carotene 15,15'-dioxygenase
MPKFSNIAIVASFFCLWIDSFFSAKFQIILGFILIFTFGILHGANDLMLIKSINDQKKSISYPKILTYYVLIVIFGALLFYFIPRISLLLFILVSGYHFGEQQWQNLKLLNKHIRFAFQICYGTFILFLLFNFHQIEVQNIISEITASKFNIEVITIGFKIISIVLISFFLYLYMYQIEIRNQILLEIFYLGVFAIIFFSSSLIWGFAIYFIIWHSLPSIIDQITFLYGDFSKTNFVNYFKSAALYWIVSLIGLGIFYSIFKDLKLFNSMFFSFLAAITFPHVLVILKMFGKKG